MKIFLTFLVLLFCSKGVHSQSPVLTAHLGLGFWSQRLPNTETYYLTIEDWQSGTQSFGASLDFSPGNRFSFTPLLDVNLYRRSHAIKARTFWDLNGYMHTGQKLRFSAFVGGGPWIGSLGYNDVYAGDYQKWQLNFSGGCEGELLVKKSFGISLRGGLDFYFLKHRYSNAKDSRTVDADLRMGYGMFAPGIRVYPRESIVLGLDFNNLISFSSSGYYQITSYNSTTGQPDTIPFVDQFSRIQRRWNPAMEVTCGWRLPILESRPIMIRLASRFAFEGLFKPAFFTPFNPRPTLVRLEFVFQINGRDREQ